VGSLFYMKHAYDVVFCEWQRVLRPGGVCVFSHTLEWQTEELFSALETHGLRVEEQSALCDLHPHNELYQVS
jgi:ubiquinone/menaquinone biosynthesis C-methylase UbiE